MTPVPPVIASPPYRNRGGGLKAFGILQIILGSLSAFSIPFMLLTLLVPAKMPDGEIIQVNVLVPLLTNGGLAVALIWLGIGSLQAQRWARTLIMLSSWGALFGGLWLMVVTIYAMIFGLPEIDGQALPPGAGFVALLFSMAIMGTMFVLLPAILGWYYSRPDVKATCEARHPHPGWTDVCSPTVLALSLWQALGAISMLVFAIGNHGVIPVFGEVLTGWAGIVICLVQGTLGAGAAWMLYRLKPSGWWLTFALLLCATVSILLNALHLDNDQLYRAMGYGATQLKQIRQFDVMRGSKGIVFSAVVTLPMMILLARTYRHCIRPRAERL